MDADHFAVEADQERVVRGQQEHIRRQSVTFGAYANREPVQSLLHSHGQFKEFRRLAVVAENDVPTLAPLRVLFHLRFRRARTRGYRKLSEREVKHSYFFPYT